MRRITLVLVAVAVGLGAVALLSRGDDRYEVVVHLRDAGGLRQGADVRVGNVRVGEVASLDLDRHDRVVATLEVDDSVAPVGRGARADVRSRSLLGGVYVDLQPGDASRDPAPSGTAIPMARTGIAVSLDQVLDVLEPTTRDRLTILLNEAGTALAGRGADLASLIGVLPPSLAKTTQLIASFAEDNTALARLVDDSDRLLAAVTPQRASLVALVESAQRALSATAARASALGSTIDEAPATLAQLRATLAELDRAAGPLTPASRALRDAAPQLTRVLRETPRAAPQVRATLRKLRSATPPLTSVGRAGAPLLQRLTPSADLLANVAGTADPTVRQVDESTPEILRIMESWARATQTRDAAGHHYRGQLSVTNDLVRALIYDLSGSSATLPRAAARRAGSTASSAATRSGAPAARTPKPAATPGSATAAPPSTGPFAPAPPVAPRPAGDGAGTPDGGLRLPGLDLSFLDRLLGRK